MQSTTSQAVRIPSILGERVAPKAILPVDPFTTIRDQLLARHPLSGTKREQFERFLRLAVDAENLHRDVDGLFKRTSEILGVQPAPLPSFPARNVLSAQLWSKDEAEIHATLERASKELAETTVQAWKAEFTRRTYEYGRMAWMCSDACKYSYFRHQSFEQVIATRAQEQHLGDTIHSVVSTDILRTVLHMKHTHDLIEAVPTPVASSRVPLPEYVQTFLAATPQWLKGHLVIVSGTLVNESIDTQATRTVRTEHQVFTRQAMVYDPALVLGEFVITGWTDLEGREPARKRQEEMLRREQEKLYIEQDREERARRDAHNNSFSVLFGFGKRI